MKTTPLAVVLLIAVSKWRSGSYTAPAWSGRMSGKIGDNEKWTF